MATCALGALGEIGERRTHCAPVHTMGWRAMGEAHPILTCTPQEPGSLVKFSMVGALGDFGFGNAPDARRPT